MLTTCLKAPISELKRAFMRDREGFHRERELILKYSMSQTIDRLRHRKMGHPNRKAYFVVSTNAWIMGVSRFLQWLVSEIVVIIVLCMKKCESPTLHASTETKTLRVWAWVPHIFVCEYVLMCAANCYWWRLWDGPPKTLWEWYSFLPVV